MPGSKCLHHPTVPGPGRASLCRATTLLLPAALVPGMKASSSGLTSLLASGPGWLMIAGRKEAGDRNVLPSWHSPFPSLFLSFWAFCFKGSALRMFSFSCTCRCDSLPRDVSFFIWENPWCVLRDGHTRPRNNQHVQTSAIFLQTKPAGRIFAISPR